VTVACVLCGTALARFDTAVVLRKYEVDYYRCARCGLIALPDPTWLDEAYDSAIYDGDSGLLRRSRVLSTVTAALIRSEGLSGGTFLDWAGGYGTLTRMMRDKGFAFFTADAYAKNLLAPGYDGDPLASYDLVTAFEVLEHLSDPVAELTALAAGNDRLFFTTQLQPAQPPRPDEWAYYALESGQHVSFHTVASLRRVADALGYQLTSNGDNYHLFHRVPIRTSTRLLLSPEVARAKRSTLAGARALLSGVRSARHRGRPVRS
jgi:hypothetical protein